MNDMKPGQGSAGLETENQELRQVNADLERRLTLQSRRLEEAVKELESFAYTISHDFRGPLRTVEGFARIVIEDYQQILPPEGQDALMRVRAGIDRMTLMFDGLLRFSRLTRQPLASEEIDLAAICREIVDELRGSHPSQVIELAIGEVPPCRGDPALIRVALAGLLENAVKFSAPRPVTRIGIRSGIEDGERVYEIRDNGVGFEMKYADKLFGVFQRLHGDEEFPGIGMGLAICRRILRRHGGRISAEGVPDQGAVVRFVIPQGGDNL